MPDPLPGLFRLEIRLTHAGGIPRVPWGPSRGGPVDGPHAVRLGYEGENHVSKYQTKRLGQGIHTASSVLASLGRREKARNVLKPTSRRPQGSILCCPWICVPSSVPDEDRNSIPGLPAPPVKFQRKKSHRVHHAHRDCTGIHEGGPLSC